MKCRSLVLVVVCAGLEMPSAAQAGWIPNGNSVCPASAQEHETRKMVLLR
jgi:hypothetical protein